MGKYIIKTVAVVVFLFSTANAVTYYVASTGNDDDNGLDSSTAWASIDNGDSKGLLSPGDTVNILPGTYPVSGSVQLTTSGTSATPVVYRRFGDSAVVVDAGSGAFTILQIEGDHVTVQNLSCTGSSGIGVAVNGDSCSVIGCSVYDIDSSAISIPGSYNLIQRCQISNIQNHALLNDQTGQNNRYYGNTIYGATIGVNMGPVQTARIFNNIIVSVTTGINGGSGNTCGFNDIWDFSSSDYSGGVSDSAGGISDDPQFTDAWNSDFQLLGSSPCIDAGLDLGYPFLGGAPDMGALEFIPVDSGKAVWRSGISTIPRYSVWDGTAFGPANNTVDIGDFRIIAGAESPHRDEAMIVGVDESSQISAAIWDGAVWSDLPLNPLATVSESFWWGFDVAYMSLAGDGVMVWNNGDTGPNGLSYCTFNDTLISEVNPISTPLNGELKHMHLAANPNSDEMVLVISNQNSRDFALVWDGSGWGHSMILSPVGTGEDRTDISVAYEHQSGRAMAVYGKGTTDVYYRIWNGTSWSAAESLVKPADADGTVRWTMLASRPGSNHIVLGVLTNNQDIWLCVWDGISWETPFTATNSALGTDFPAVAVAFESQSGKGLATYGEATSVRYRSWSSSSGWSIEGTAANIGTAPNSMMLDAAPNSNHIMLSVQDDGSNLNFVLWDGKAWGTPNELETNTAEVKNQPFIFLWNVKLPSNHPPVLAAIGPQSTTENINLNFGVSATDEESTPVLTTSSLPVGANFIDNGDGTGTFDWTPMYPSAGDYEVTFYATDDSAAVDSEVVLITVTPAILDHLVIEPDSAVVSADSTLQFSVTGYDADSNEADPGVITWDLTDALGTIDSTGLFDAIVTGIGQVIATSDKGPVDTNTYLEVIPGKLDSMYIIPDRDTISADSTRQFTTVGFDSEGNATTDFGVLTWDVVLNIGTIDSTGLFDAGKVGFGFIKATSDLSPVAQTDTIFVIPGAVVEIDLTPDNDIVEATTSLQFDVNALDSDSNLVWAQRDSIIWSTSDSTGSITDSGFYTAGTTVGFYWIFGEYGSLKDSSQVEVVGSGTIDHIIIEYFDGTPVGDTNLTTDNDSTQLYCRAYDNSSTLLGDVAVDWVLIDDSIGYFQPLHSSSTVLILTTPGNGRVTAYDAPGLYDTTGVITCVPGVPAQLIVSPDTATVSADSTLQFTSQSLDADGNNSNPTVIPTWSVLNGIGTIDSTGLFDATTADTGFIVAEGSGLADTTGPVIVIPGDLANIEIIPDTISLGIGDTVQFTAQGYDSDSNITDAGTITWDALGRVGTIDSDGLFIASKPGLGKVIGVSSIGAATDTSGFLDVEELYLTTISIGNVYARPFSDLNSILAFRIDNYFDVDKSVTGINLHDVSRGFGTGAELLSNVDSIKLYIDIDNDSILTASDSLVAETEYSGNPINLNFPDITINPDSGRTFLFGGQISAYPRDGDSIDVFLDPAADIVTGDATVVAGPDSVNSLGYGIVDGCVAAQIIPNDAGRDYLYPEDSSQVIMVIDIPRNGYQADMLNIFSLENMGTAQYTDFDSLFLYQDDGNNIWDGFPADVFLGNLEYTGSRWILSGLNTPLDQPLNRLYILGDLSDFPENNATIIPTVPPSGLEFSSGNDGPLDFALSPIDTIVIQTNEKIMLEAVDVEPYSLIPGSSDNPILAIKIVNGYHTSRTIDSVLFNLIAVDPDGATQDQLDSQIDSLLLYVINDINNDDLSNYDSLISVATVSGGTALINFNGFGFLSNGDGAIFVIVAALNPENCKNGNELNLEIPDSTHLFFNLSSELSGVFPVKNIDNFVIDAFPAAGVDVTPLEAKTIRGGEVNQKVFEFTLPDNGYAEDSLAMIKILRSGTFNGESIFRLWVDTTGIGGDPFIGIFTEFGDFLRITGLNIPVDSSGRRFYVTADIPDHQFGGGILALSIPIGGISYVSGMTGPDDIGIDNPNDHLIIPSNRIFAFSSQMETSTVYPGSTGNIAMTLVLYNAYLDQDQVLKSIIVSNNSVSQTDSAFADYEMGQISLYYDDDKNGIWDDDSLLATGYLTDGELILSGFGISLPADSQVHCFIGTDLPLDVIDNDSLLLSIAAPADIIFENAVNLNSDFPLTRGGYMTVNGSIAGQYGLLPLPSRTLFPGDSDVVLLTFQPALNGNLEDTLTSVVITNGGSADTSDIAPVTLWLDSSYDSLWQATDLLLDTMTFAGSSWEVDGLQLPLGGSRPTLFVLADISDSAAGDRTIQLQIPLNGIDYISGNDGPIDDLLTAGSKFTISKSSLSVTLDELNRYYSVGQALTVSMTVTNISDSLVHDVSAEIYSVTNPAIVTLDSSFIGPLSLAPTESVVFQYFYTASATGEIQWQLRAGAPGLTIPSAIVQTETVNIQNIPSYVEVSMINSIPASVIKGQKNVFPFSLKLLQPDSSATLSSVFLDSLRLAVEDASGAPQSAATAISKMVLTSGYQTLAVIDSVPDIAEIVFVFDSTMVLAPGKERQITLLIDIDSLATADELVLSLNSSGSLYFYDRNTLQAIPIDSSVNFPLKTASCRIDDGSQIMAVSYESAVGPSANFGQQDVEIMMLRLRHPGTSGYSQIQMTALSAVFSTTGSDTVTASNLISVMRLYNNQNLISEISGASLTQGVLDISLTQPLTLNPGEYDSIYIHVDLLTETAVSQFMLVIPDSLSFEVRDLSSGQPLPTTGDVTMATNNTFPMSSSLVSLIFAAVSPEFCLVDVSPLSVVTGTDMVALANFDIAYPVGIEYSWFNLKNVTAAIIDSAGTPLDPYKLFDRVGYSVNNGAVIYQPFINLKNGRTVFVTESDNFSINPGDSISITIYSDIEIDTEYDNFRLLLESEDAVYLVDVNDTTNNPGFTPMAGCNYNFPFYTTNTNILKAAGRPYVNAGDRGVTLTYPGADSLVVFDAYLYYTSGQSVGNLLLSSIYGRLYRRTSGGISLINGQEIFANIEVIINDATIAIPSFSSQDSIFLEFLDDYVIHNGDSLHLLCRGQLKQGIPYGNYFIRFEDSAFIALTDQDLGVEIYPLLGQSYPFSTNEFSLSPAGLESSFTNYPNPFNPARGEHTIIGFTLTEDAYIDIEIFTVTGELVKKLTANEFRTAGAHQDDLWHGRNGIDQNVVPGTYFCRITARYLSGHEESYRRKIAVIR